jgi:hypothetical protein
MNRHLHVVRDEPAEPKRRRGLRPPPVLSAEQQRAAKASIRGLAVSRYGTLAKMSTAIGYYPDTLSHALTAGRRVTADVLVRVALATGTPLDRLVTPGPRGVVP